MIKSTVSSPTNCLFSLPNQNLANIAHYIDLCFSLDISSTVAFSRYLVSSRCFYIFFLQMIFHVERPMATVLIDGINRPWSTKLTHYICLIQNRFVHWLLLFLCWNDYQLGACTGKSCNLIYVLLWINTKENWTWTFVCYGYQK